MCAQCPRARKPRDFTPPRSKPDSRWITAGQSAIHGRGVYARELIPDGTPVIEYTGERITKAEAARREIKGHSAIRMAKFVQL